MTKLYVTSASSFPRAMNTPNKQKDQNSLLHEKIPLLLVSLSQLQYTKESTSFSCDNKHWHYEKNLPSK